MQAFGVRFTVDDAKRYEQLRSLFMEIKRDKDADQFRDPDEWVRLVPDEVKRGFIWPTSQQRAHWLSVRDSMPIAVPPPSEQIGSKWDFFSVFEAVEDSEYDLLECEETGDGAAEMRIDPQAYPYGGAGPFIALAEAYGFTVLGVNECGKYEPRDELLNGPKKSSKPWWQFW
jgi:hypothetical protein